MFSHHAYYIEDAPSRFEEYKELLKPFWAKSFERFGIDEARELIALASLKNFNQPVFFLAISATTSEAQQALLKLLEEPQEGTTFILLVPHGMLMPTIKSRMLAYEQERQPASQKVLGSPSGSAQPDFFTKQAAAFLGASGKERSDFITKLLKDDEGVKDRVRDLLSGIEAELSKKIADPKARLALADVAMVRDYLSDRSPSLKMLLEHLALALPTP